MIMKKIIKQLLLYLLVGITSILTIVLLGIVGLPNSIGGKIVVWLFAGLFSYSIYIFIPFFNKKSVKYYDGFLLAWAYFAIIIVIAFRTSNLEEYDYFMAFSFIVSLPFISELILKSKRNINKEKNFNIKKEIPKLFDINTWFSILDVSSKIKVSEYIIRKDLNEMVKEGFVELKKVGTKNYYKIIDKKVEDSK
jgi:hypothetical protein